MGNLTEESEFGRVIYCNEFNHNKNQNHVRNLFIPKFSKKDFVIFNQNIRGLNSNNLDELSVSLCVNPPHIICFTEHHLGINEIYTIILLANYILGGKFCKNTFKNGGVCIFTHESIQSSNINLSEFCKEKELDMCAVKLHLPSHETCIITIYRSASGNFKYFKDNLEKILSMIYSNTIKIIICGDININYLINATYKQSLDSLLTSYGLCSTVRFPTRIQMDSHSTIDNIFINTFTFSNFSLYPL